MEVRVDGWKKNIRFSSAHTTLNLGKCERLHGHTYVIHATVRGGLEDRRIVFDFVELTRLLKSIADELDHYILVPTKSPDIRVHERGEELEMVAGDARYVFPRRDCFLLPAASSTAEDLAQFVMERVRSRLQVPAHVEAIEIGVDEGFGQGAWAVWKANGKR